MTTNTGCILIDRTGWFWHTAPDGTRTCLSSARVNASPKGALTTLVRNGQATGNGDSLATRVAVGLARRYA